MTDVKGLDAGYDLDVLEKTGKYAVASPLNAPTSGRDYLIDVVSANVGGVSIAWQTAVDVFSNRKSSRTRNGGAWTAWNNERERLTAARTVYVATTGSDTTGDGTINRPWATIPKAFDEVVGGLDQCGFTVTIQISAGTYVGGFTARQSARPNGVIIIQGDINNKSSVVVTKGSGTGASAFGFSGMGRLIIRYLTIDCTEANQTAYAFSKMELNVSDVNVIGVPRNTTAHRYFYAIDGAQITLSGTINIDTTGSNDRTFLGADGNGSYVYNAATVNFNTNKNWQIAALVVRDGGGVTVAVDKGGSGVLTGKRWQNDISRPGLIVGTHARVNSYGDAIGTGIGRGNCIPTVTVAELASFPATESPSPMFYVSDAAGGSIPVFTDGTNWRRVDTREVVS